MPVVRSYHAAQVAAVMEAVASQRLSSLRAQEAVQVTEATEATEGMVAAADGKPEVTEAMVEADGKLEVAEMAVDGRPVQPGMEEQVGKLEEAGMEEPVGNPEEVEMAEDGKRLPSKSLSHNANGSVKCALEISSSQRDCYY